MKNEKDDGKKWYLISILALIIGCMVGMLADNVFTQKETHVPSVCPEPNVSQIFLDGGCPVIQNYTHCGEGMKCYPIPQREKCAEACGALNQSSFYYGAPGDGEACVCYHLADTMHEQIALEKCLDIPENESHYGGEFTIEIPRDMTFVPVKMPMIGENE